MQNNKILRQRAALYDNLLSCSQPDCGSKFTSGLDLEQHSKNAHHQKLTANGWWSLFKKELFAGKDDMEVENVKNGINTFSFGDLGDAARKVRAKNMRRYHD